MVLVVANRILLGGALIGAHSYLLCWYVWNKFWWCFAAGSLQYLLFAQGVVHCSRGGTALSAIGAGMVF